MNPILKKYLLFLLSLFFFLFFFSCEKDFSSLSKRQLLNIPDTTSHDFTWQVDSIGELTSGLFDVYAISEDNIWAVGDIKKTDSSGNKLKYNAVHWDGPKWELKRILYRGGFWTIETNFAFNSKDIWFEAFVKWDGSNFIELPIPGILIGQSIKKMWGISSNNIYVVGSGGFIAHYNGSTWQKLNSGTTINLKDVWGFKDSDVVWTCGYASNSSESILLRYDGVNWETVWKWHFQQGSSDSAYEGLLSSLWAVDSDSLIVVGGDGVYRQDVDGKSAPRVEKLYLGAFPFRVRGSASNNIFIVGDKGMVWHYNGATWKNFPQLQNPNWVFYSIAVLQNKVVVVGEDYSQVIQKDIIVTGIRL
jgi:hypothetical protein